MNLLQVLRDEVPFDKQELHALIATAPRRYKVYQIPKRDGKTFRTIAQPAPEVKILQHVVLEKIVATWPIHESATAYQTGTSISDHVSRHIRSRYLLKLDFSNFFPSISSEDIRQHAIRHSDLDKSDIDRLVNILSWRNKVTGRFILSIGAPSSPKVSNSILFEFDKRMSDYTGKREISYSRYADDLAFSTNHRDVLDGVVEEVKAALKGMSYPRLDLNLGKTINVSKRHNRTLVGLTLTPDEKVSLGRNRKRHIRAQLYRYSRGYLSALEISQLRGLLAFAWSVERDFVIRLASNQGDLLFEKLGLPFKSNA